MTLDPKQMAEHLKELGPEKVAEALCAAQAALAPLCKHHDAPTKPAEVPAPKDMAGVASAAHAAFAKPAATRESPWR